MSEQATLLFEGDLDHFLGVAKRKGPVRHRCVEPASVKDVIESHGVPHTEVDGILCDGEWVDFAHPIRGGEQIVVYPYADRDAIPDRARLVPETPRDVRFVVDGHLGTLARRLRLCGFDTVWWSDPEDDHLASVSAEGDRILLTRDVGLLKRRMIVHGHKVRATDPFDQTVEVLRRYDLAGRLSPFSRCVACNGINESVPKAEILHRLEPGTKREHDDFRRCTSCGRIYWRGTHYERLVRLVAELRDAV